MQEIQLLIFLVDNCGYLDDIDKFAINSAFNTNIVKNYDEIKKLRVDWKDINESVINIINIDQVDNVWDFLKYRCKSGDFSCIRDKKGLFWDKVREFIYDEKFSTFLSTEIFSNQKITDRLIEFYNKIDDMERKWCENLILLKKPNHIICIIISYHLGSYIYEYKNDVIEVKHTFNINILDYKRDFLEIKHFTDWPIKISYSEVINMYREYVNIREHLKKFRDRYNKCRSAVYNDIINYIVNNIYNKDE